MKNRGVSKVREYYYSCIVSGDPLRRHFPYILMDFVLCAIIINAYCMLKFSSSCFSPVRRSVSSETTAVLGECHAVSEYGASDGFK